MGIPSIITTDQGKEFYNKVNAELMNVFGIDHRLTTAYHPQANGLDERYNQTQLQYLLLHCKIKLLGFAVTVFKLDSV